MISRNLSLKTESREVKKTNPLSDMRAIHDGPTTKNLFIRLNL